VDTRRNIMPKGQDASDEVATDEVSNEEILENELEETSTESQEDANTEEPSEGAESESSQTESESSEEQVFEIEGEKYTPQQIKEMREGQLRQEDYTRKTQELAEIRKEYEQRMKDVEESKQYADYTDEQKEAIKLIEQIAEEKAKKIIDPISQQMTDAQIDKEIEETKQKHNLNDDQMLDLLEFARDNNMPSLDIAYKAKYFDELIPKAKEEGEQKATKNIQQRKAAISESGQSSGNVKSGQVDVRGKDYDDLTEMALNDEEILKK